jgi:hypothetical protein
VASGGRTGRPTSEGVEHQEGRWCLAAGSRWTSRPQEVMGGSGRRDPLALAGHTVVTSRLGQEPTEVLVLLRLP